MEKQELPQNLDSLFSIASEALMTMNNTYKSLYFGANKQLAEANEKIKELEEKIQPKKVKK